MVDAIIAQAGKLDDSPALLLASSQYCQTPGTYDPRCVREIAHEDMERHRGPGDRRPRRAERDVLVGMAIGGGLLVVPAANVLTAFGN